jgi:Fic family protein
MSDHFFVLLNRFETLNIRVTIDFKLMNDILISYHSTAIEGSSLTEEEARLLLLEGITAKGKPLEHHNMVKDHQKALHHIFGFAKEKQRITPDFLQEINANVMRTTGSAINSIAGSYDSSKGDFRKSMVHLGDRYFSNYQKVPQEVGNLCEDINKKINTVSHPVEIYNLAFDAHFQLVSIHPWADGNGRTSRLLMNYILQYHDQPLSIVFKEDKADYFRALEDARLNSDVRYFRDFMYSQQIKYLSNEIDKVRSAEKGIKFEEL